MSSASGFSPAVYAPTKPFVLILNLDDFGDADGALFTAVLPLACAEWLSPLNLPFAFVAVVFIFVLEEEDAEERLSDGLLPAVLLLVIFPGIAISV